MSPEEKSIREKLLGSGSPLPDLEAELDRLRRENTDLRSIIEELLRRLWGKKSEKVPRPEKEPSPTTSDPGKKPESAKKPGHGRTPLAAHLPRETVTNDVPESERYCRVCKTALVRMGSDVCERGHVEPVRVIVRRWVSNKYGCPQGHEVRTAEGAPSGLVDRAKWTTETYAFLAVAKYGDHQPLDRLESSLKHRGIVLPKSTMADMVDLAGDKFALVLKQAKLELLGKDHVQADETPIDVMVEGQKGTKSGYLWAWRAGEKLLFDFDFSRGQETPKRFLGSWTGTLQTDGYQGYDAVVRDNGIRHAGCWSHARRKWKEAFDLRFREAEVMLRMMARLWRIEAAVKGRAKTRRLTPDDADKLLGRVRDERSRNVVARIRSTLDQLLLRTDLVPKSPLAKAVTYLQNQWPSLLLFLDDPKLEIDTNGLEREMRSVALGRKNWYVAGSPKGAQTAARLFSIINTCKSLGIDPYAYMADVLEKISPNANLAALTPWAWAKARPAPPPTP